MLVRCRAVKQDVRFWPLTDHSGGKRPRRLRLRLFRHFEGIIDFDAQISNRALELGVSEKQLDGP